MKIKANSLRRGAVLVLIFVALGLNGVVVLCVGGDGHLELEPVAPLCWGECGPCTDISLLGAVESRSPSSGGNWLDIDLPAAVPATVAAWTSPVAERLGRLLDPLVFMRLVLASVRTVVLLT